ncbi:MAG TPA: hypothetical protein VF808_03180 [Ktedonobacterales bacterium]
MGHQWDEPAGDSTLPQAAVQPGTEPAPTVVDGRVTHISERPPLPPAGGYLPPANWGMYAPSPYGGYASLPQQPEREPSALSQPFPIWLTIAAPLVMLLTLAMAFGAEVFLLGADWATGALAAALAAFALAVVTVIVLAVRLIAGRRSGGTVALSAVLALALVAAGVGGITQLNPLRHAQAGQFEAARQWQPAIDEYAQSGESAPNAPDIARIYTEWGESLGQSKDYAGAAEKLTTVVQTYAQSGSEVARAQADLYNTYVGWISTGATNVPFQQAINFLTSYATNPVCDASCQQSISGVSAEAHYQYGQQLLQANQYKQAITELELVQTQYPTTQYVPQAHAAAAQAYLALAQQTLSQDCASAVPLYQTLAKNYGDTDQGKQAKKKLGAPVQVTGVVSGAPKSPPVTIYLSRHVAPSRYYASGEYKVKLSSSGTFSFPAVTPGVYYPTGLQTTSTQIIYSYWPGNPAYSVTVGPLCAFQIPALNW